MNNREAEESAETKPTVVQGLGYPNNRTEISPEPTGWHGLAQTEINDVSRETLPKVEGK